MEIGETLEDAALRELKEETGVTGIPLQQIHTFSDLNRDPRGRVISTVYAGIIKSTMMKNIQAGSDAQKVRWFNMKDLPQLAFDHLQILRKAAESFGLAIDDA
jgi:8-oxo-dGTP diphosphatase